MGPVLNGAKTARQRTGPKRAVKKGEDNLKLRIDLKIILFAIIFVFTGQLKIYLIIMFFCLLHELGHICVAKLLKIKLEKVEILPCGFSASFYNLKAGKEEIIVAIAGPIVSFTLAMLFQYIDIIKISNILKQEIVYSNILILIFNLLPIYPLDGGRILKNILHKGMKNLKTEKIINKISYITIVVLTIISSIAVYYFKNIAIFLVCIFLWIIILKDKFNQNFKMNSI